MTVNYFTTMRFACLLAVLLLLSFTHVIQQESFKPLFQLTGGTWKMKTATGFTCEQWNKTSDTELNGRGFRLAGSDTTVEEQIQLLIRGSYVFYIPTVSGQNNGQPVPFKLISAYKNTYIFNNPNHDYPQIVAYQFVSKDSINAWIDGNLHGKKKRIDFHYKRVN